MKRSPERIEALKEGLYLPDFDRVVDSRFAKCERYQLSLAIALLHSPRLLVLEEPFHITERLYKHT